MRIALAAIGLSFLLYCLVRVAINRKHYTFLQLTLWLLLIYGGAWCIVSLFVR